jgi:hypothetical protein
LNVDLLAGHIADFTLAALQAVGSRQSPGGSRRRTRTKER